MKHSWVGKELFLKGQLFCHIPLIQICNTTWGKAGEMSSMVTTIIAAGRNLTIDYNAGEVCDVAIKMFTWIKIAWDRVERMLGQCLWSLQLYGNQTLTVNPIAYGGGAFLARAIRLSAITLEPFHLGSPNFLTSPFYSLDTLWRKFR